MRRMRSSAAAWLGLQAGSCWCQTRLHACIVCPASYVALQAKVCLLPAHSSTRHVCGLHLPISRTRRGMTPAEWLDMSGGMIAGSLMVPSQVRG